ncbi:hypothetical protein BTW08_02895 [Salinicola sp. MH3R3-1]|uniref:hypothetical protein n=1 Tax=Salinicola sp. MH3R3-1 TaxID=1928762 RepID=UPI00094E7819|nr:hypothetical protein [Salinicola sp. MH3R3-1]OLO09171.1 hypothetical protein BTW08_02895 [Salinicola sp. MH3R3-1]
MEQFFSTVITSALVATVAGAAINAWLENRKDRQATKFDALSAAVSLEGYAITCAENLADHDLAKASDGHAGSFIGRVPDLPDLSVVAGFIKPQKAEIAHRLMVFPQEVRQADQVAAFLWDVAVDVEATRAAAADQAARMGLYASELAKDIRRVFLLPKRDLVVGEFDVNKVLKEYIRHDEDEA